METDTVELETSTDPPQNQSLIPVNSASSYVCVTVISATRNIDFNCVAQNRNHMTTLQRLAKFLENLTCLGDTTLDTGIKRIATE